MARVTLTTTPVVLLENAVKAASRDDAAARTFFVVAPSGTGTALLERIEPGDELGDIDWSEATRFPFSALGLNYTLEPGVSLAAKVASGTLDLDILQGGER